MSNFVVVDSDGEIYGVGDREEMMSIYLSELHRNSLTEDEDPVYDVRQRDDVVFIEGIDDIVQGVEIEGENEDDVEFGLYLKAS